MNYSIDKELWHSCQVCNATIQQLAKQYGGNGVYYTDVFKKHLKYDHNMSLEQYFESYTDRPICACGICGQQVHVRGIHKTNFYWGEYQCGRFPGLLKWSEKAKTTRKGSGNPMHGQPAWNKGVTKYDHPSMMQSALKNKGRITSEKTKQKQSDAAKCRLIHGHTGHKHSEASKELMRQSTLRRIHNGEFEHLISKPHLLMATMLTSLNVEYEEEKIVAKWSFDFYLPKYDIYIEVDGDYFHSNPKTYPDGPKTKTQKRNWYRDIKKNKHCDDNQLKLFRFWECDILNNETDNGATCKLKELLELSL